jgi:uncharacterized protein
MNECSDEPSGELLRGIGEFNREEWFSCHEVIERLWMREENPVLRDFLKGFIQVAIGLHHWRNGNFGGAVRVMEGGVGYLLTVGPACLRVDVAGLAADGERFREELIALGRERMAEVDRSLIPVVRLVPSEP